MESFSRSGLVFPVRDNAPPGDRQGTIVLLHGFPQGPWTWSAVVPTLAQAGYRVVVPTLRGYSSTARPVGIRAYAVDELCGDVEALIAAVGDGPVHLVGHDWGANIAWAFAARRPDLVLTVTGVSVPPLKAYLQGLQNPRQWRSSWYVGAFLVPGLVEAASKTPFFERRLVGLLMASGQRAERARRDVTSLLATPGGLSAAVAYYRAAALSSRHGSTEDIAVPALFVWSTGDTAVTSAAVRSAARSVAGRYRSATLLGVSHWIPEEAPAELARLILEHVS